MPGRSPYVIELSKTEREEIGARARKYTSPYRDVIRAKIVLLAAAGLPNDVIAAFLPGSSRRPRNAEGAAAWSAALRAMEAAGSPASRASRSGGSGSTPGPRGPCSARRPAKLKQNCWRSESGRYPPRACPPRCPS
jgi:hypothetical protein